MTRATTCSIEELISLEQNIIGIITLKDGKPIGTVAFLNHDSVNRKAELRKLIGDSEYRGKGYGKEATKYWIKYGFEILKLQKIYLNTTETNFHNIKINEELGFKVEGILRDEILMDGIPHDVLRMGLLNENF
jgi:RimJ/RimL family protein N-acetyltransferase